MLNADLTLLEQYRQDFHAALDALRRGLPKQNVLPEMTIPQKVNAM